MNRMFVTETGRTYPDDYVGDVLEDLENHAKEVYGFLVSNYSENEIESLVLGCLRDGYDEFQDSLEEKIEVSVFAAELELRRTLELEMGV